MQKVGLVLLTNSVFSYNSCGQLVVSPFEIVFYIFVFPMRSSTLFLALFSFFSKMSFGKQILHSFSDLLALVLVYLKKVFYYYIALLLWLWIVNLISITFLRNRLFGKISDSPMKTFSKYSS